MKASVAEELAPVMDMGFRVNPEIAVGLGVPLPPHLAGQAGPPPASGAETRALMIDYIVQQLLWSS